MAATWLNSFLNELVGLPQTSLVTGIPRSTLYNYRAGRYKPSLSRLKTLRRQYERVQYWRVRIAGGTTADARRFRGGSPATVTDVISKLDRISSSVAKTYGKEKYVASIKLAMSRSRRSWIDKPPIYLAEEVDLEEE